jgi:hypothetical protein
MVTRMATAWLGGWVAVVGFGWLGSQGGELVALAIDESPVDPPPPREVSLRRR